MITNTPSQDIRSSMPQHPYPLVRSGGLFLVFIGGGIIGAIFLSGVAFIVGTVLAIMSLMFSKVLSFGKPTPIQIMALVLAIALEIVLFIVMVNALPADVAGAVRLDWILIIVGVHFLPMAISFGPRVGALGALCIVNALAGLVITGTANEIVLILDGVLKVVFGIWLFSDKAPAT